MEHVLRQAANTGTGTGTATPSRDGTVRAELWADALIKVLSCWIPLALASAVVGGNLLGPSLECFPMHLTSAVSANASNANGSSAEAFRNPGLYSSQLDEFVNAYCGKQMRFDYRVFSLMLVAQSVVMFAPQLLWNMTPGREVICKLNFIRQCLEVLYKAFGPEDFKMNQRSEKTELVTFVENLLKEKKLYIIYLVKQILTAILTVPSIVLFCTIQSAFVSSIQDNFNCTVSKDFTVDCSVTSASLYRIVWWTNIILLVLSVLTFIGAMYYLHYHLDTNPFSDVGIIDRTTNDDQNPSPNRCSKLKPKDVTDCHLMYTFLKANIDVIEKYNYIAILCQVFETRQSDRALAGADQQAETTV